MLGHVDPQKVTIAPFGATVYQTYDNFVAVRFLQHDTVTRRDVPLDWSDVTRMVLVLPEVDLVFDSATAPDSLDWTTHGAGVLELKLAQYEIPMGEYRAQLIAYDLEHPNGQVIVSGLQTRNEFVVTVNQVSIGGEEPPGPAPDGVTSFNTRTGAVTLTGADVTAALGYTPAESAGDLATVAATGQYGDLLGKPTIPSTPGDIGAATAAQGALATTAVQPAALTAGLALKVDKVTGYGLSQADFTTAEKAKLAGLEGSHYRGTFVNLTALNAALPDANAGDYADVDAGTGSPVLRYIWDDNDAEWVAQAGSADPITAAQVKTLYESNPDTNAFTDARLSKLNGIAAGATANANTDSLTEGSTNLYHTAARVLATLLSGLSLATGTAVVNTDSVLVAIGKLQKQITDLAASVTTGLAGKQSTLISGTNIKSINGTSLLGSGDLTVSGGGGSTAWGGITGTLASQTDLQAALDAKVALAGLPGRGVTTSGAITPSDAGRWIVCTNTTAITLTIGAEATAAWPATGFPAVNILRLGSGSVTVTGDGFSVSVHSTDTNALDGAVSAATAVRSAANTWALIGRLVAA